MAELGELISSLDEQHKAALSRALGERRDSMEPAEQAPHLPVRRRIGQFGLKITDNLNAAYDALTGPLQRWQDRRQHIVMSPGGSPTQPEDVIDLGNTSDQLHQADVKRLTRKPGYELEHGLDIFDTDEAA